MNGTDPRREPWDDRRLEAAFAARASRFPAPADLHDQVVGRLLTQDPPQPVWRRWLPAAAVVVLAVGVAAGGIGLLGDRVGRDLFRPGPTSELRTFDNGEFAFDYPATWLGYDASASFSGGSADAVLGTQPVGAGCGSERHVDINCVSQERIEEGHIRLYVGTGTYRQGTIEDHPTIEGRTTTRLEVGGMPAFRLESDRQPDSYYREDLSLHVEIARPGTGGRSVVELEARIREPVVAEARRQFDALIASFRFTHGPDPSRPPTPEPTPTEAAPRLSDLREMTVEELIRAKASPTSEEVIVEGWLTPANVVFDCNVKADPHPLIAHCQDFGLTLTDERISSDRGIVGPPITHIVPMLGMDAHSDVSALPGSIEVRAIGHLLDHRWTTCPEDHQTECKRRFVVDRVLPVGQSLTDDLPVPWASPADHPTDGATDAVEAVSTVVGGLRIVSIGVADGETLRSIEPRVEDINNGEGAWVIRALVAGDPAPVARTFLVGHIGWWTVFEVTESAVVDLVAKPASFAPTDVLGLPVLSVEGAMTIRDAGRDDREIAVHGWFPPQRSLRCRAPDPPITFFLEPYCQDGFSLLMSDHNVLFSLPPDSAAISIEMDDVALVPKHRDALGQIRAIELVAIGHFDDRRAGWCHASRIDACRDRFVVDRVAWADGDAQPLSVVTHGKVDQSGFDAVEAVIQERAGEAPILSAAGYRGDGLSAIEPSLRENRPGITDQEAVWAIRLLDGGRAITYLVVDGTERVYLVETDGRTVLVGGDPSEDPMRSWPPPGVLDVPMPKGDTGLAPRAGVVDRTGLLLEARAAGHADPGWPLNDLKPGEMAIVQAAPDTVIAYWNGSMCDDRLVLTVYGERSGQPPDRLQLRGERADMCRLALVHYGMRLRFRMPLDASTIQGFDRVGTPFEAFPPVNATVVALPNDGGFSLPKVRAALVDLSGRITAVRLPRPDEPRPDAGQANSGVLVPDPSVPGRYQLAWIGGPCAPDIVITIDASISRVVVTNTVPPDPPDCDTIAQLYRLTLDIDGQLEPPAVEVRHADMSAGAS
jgi:hypothetical protein